MGKWKKKKGALCRWKALDIWQWCTSQSVKNHFFPPQIHPGFTVMLAIFISSSLALSSCWLSWGERASICSELLAGCNDCLHIPSWLQWAPQLREIEYAFPYPLHFAFVLLFQREKKGRYQNIYSWVLVYTTLYIFIPLLTIGLNRALL